ncbi:MAG: hypothetical protein PHY64_07150, partial [Eubacteriales bacterium]|nr:hypothetical protein [Eubacteriales bacterium]
AAVSAAIGQNAFQANPVWTDELDYWRGVFSWLNAGGTTGYSGIGEQTALMGTLSVHGVTPLLLYGWYGALFGWDFSSIVMCNALWVALGGLAFVVFNRPRAGVAFGIGLALMVYAPAVLYCATSMTELANYGLLLFYLAFMVRLFRVRAKARKRLTENPPMTKGLLSLILAAITVAVCCTYRVTYFVLCIPLIVIACDGQWSGKMMLGFLAAFLVTVFIYYFTSLYASPFITGFLYNFLRAGSTGLSVRMFLSHAKANLLDYFVREPGSLMESLQRWLYCVVAAWCLLGTFVRVKKELGRWRVRFGVDGFSLMAFLMLFLPFAVVVVAYETNDWSDYRTLAPFLWLVVAAYIVHGRKWVPAVFLAGCVAVLGVLATGSPVGAYGDDYRFVSQPFSGEAQALCNAIEYDATAENPYANTVRTDLFNLETVAMLDPGMGLETGWFTDDTVGKSRWILTDHLKIALEGYELVLKNDAGSVYRLIADYE